MSAMTDLQKDLAQHAFPEKAKFLQRFFKTGPGEYAEGDKFLGLTVPQSRQLAKKYKHIALDKVKDLLNSEWHEERLIALFILVERFKKADVTLRQEILDFYLNSTDQINNWDLVDSSADKIVGEWLLSKSPQDRLAVLAPLARSKKLWKKRIAIIATFQFIKNNQLDETFTIAEILLRDPHDLIHKAVGWMLREAGKRNLTAEETFLKEQYRHMPRTMLRYAIEKFPEAQRQQYLRGEI
jgi:3-methyladenine DNA glycosylase AlkD